jgi:hypothetical protein
VGPETPAAHWPSPRQKVDADALVPLFKRLTGKFALSEAAEPDVFWFSVGNVQFVSVPLEGVPSAPPLTKFPLAVPVKAAVIVPAVKLPEPSRATIALAVFADVAVVAELLTFKAVEIVASFVSTIAADALMSASTITPAAIEVALPTDVTSPVKLALVVTVDALPVKEAVIVPALKFPDASRATIADAVFADVAVVAELLTFAAVEIVASLVSTMPAEALMSASTITPAAILVAFPTEVTSPVKLALVVTLPAVKPEAVPVKLVAVPLEGVPNAPPLTTNAPEEPVFIPSAVATPVPRDVMPVPPEAAGSAEPKVKEVKYEAASTTFVPLL